MTDNPAETRDGKGRPHPDLMSERELLTELVTNLRTLADVVEDLAQTPMVAALQNGSNPFMAMFGRG